MNRNIQRIPILSTLLLCMLGTDYSWGVKGPEHRTLRPLAMGNAFVAVVDDKDALHYNPAGLNLIAFFFEQILNTAVYYL